MLRHNFRITFFQLFEKQVFFGYHGTYFYYQDETLIALLLNCYIVIFQFIACLCYFQTYISLVGIL